jgi:hypothetical protein
MYIRIYALKSVLVGILSVSNLLCLLYDIYYMPMHTCMNVHNLVSMSNSLSNLFLLVCLSCV